MSENPIDKLIERLKRYEASIHVYESHNIINRKDETGAYDMQIGEFSTTEGDNFIGNHCDIDSVHIIYNWKIREKKEEDK